MIKVKQVATSVAAAFALGYGASASAVVAMPGAAAEGMFTLDTFRICLGNGVGSAGGTGATCAGGFPVFSTLLGTEEAGATARVNGVSASINPPLAGLGSTFSATAVVGAGFTPGTPIPILAPTGQYAGGHSFSTGFALSPGGANVLLHSQTQLNTFGSDSSASSQQTLNSTFIFETKFS